ncbi:MAG: hypothetical protein H6744_18035 [Deltaproteobacteria bacterium]|nr:hypothetical protein [Deltaproteobacteria bacterium]MCB9788581.1 hypothetical protein [Deltaproteobacteria bacterium]
MPTDAPPLAARLILLRPARVQRRLAQVRAAGVVDPVPNTWQAATGVLRMLHRIIRRPETIGMSREFQPRANLRARLFQYRPLRAPFLLWERSVAPLDLSGLVSPSERIARHLLGTHHDGIQFVYDLQLLALEPGALERLRDAARAVVERDDRRSRWLRDLAVYERYHEKLLEAVEEAVRDGIRVPPPFDDDPDVSLVAWLRWCASQPPTPAGTWRAWRSGRLRFAPEPAESRP